MKLSLFILSIFISALLYGQVEVTTPILDVKKSYSNDWKVYVDESDFAIEYKFEACDFNSGIDEELLLFKIKNKTSDELNIDWHIQLYYGAECSTCDFPQEYTRSLKLSANEILIGDCTLSNNHPLRIFSKFTDAKFASKSRALVKFQLAELNYTFK